MYKYAGFQLAHKRSEFTSGFHVVVVTPDVLTLMPSNRDRALRGRRARSVLRDLMALSSE